jgi:biofilm protein TabA
MFIGRTVDLSNALTCLPPALAAAFKECLAQDLKNLPAGKYDLKAGGFFLVQDAKTKPFVETRPEAHRAMIDIQYIVTGRERFGMAHADENLKPVEDRLDEKDLAFYPAPDGEFFVNAAAGDFMVFFPGEIHRPMGCVDGPENIRKIVVKFPFEKI